ncbi:MAG: alpha/beta fold hydrolase [Candidatus Acidoferrales bacterium]
MVAPRYTRRRERGLLVTLSHVLNELRYPTTPRAKISVGVLAALLFLFLCLVVVGGFLLSGALVLRQAGESIDPSGLLINVEVVEFTTPEGETLKGWFFPGSRGGPAVILCHGYRSSRLDILTLTTTLQNHGYNVFTFNFAGHGDSPVGYTTLGYKETEELLAALEALAARDDIDRERIGLWGYSLGGYAVLNAAPRFPAVKAVAVDSVYLRPSQMLELDRNRVGLGHIPVLSSVTLLEFYFLSWFWGNPGSLLESVADTAGLPKLFITGNDAPQLAEMTRDLFASAPGPKELKEMSGTNMATLLEDQRRDYERLVANFFLRYLPLVET